MRLYVCMVFVVLCSCQAKQNNYKKLFAKNETLLNNTVLFVQENFEALRSSPCTGRFGISLSSYTIHTKSCYPSLKDTVQSYLNKGIYEAINVRGKNDILFWLDFTPDAVLTETTIYFLYYEGEELPSYYERWKGTKSKLNKGWWYIERVEAQF